MKVKTTVYDAKTKEYKIEYVEQEDIPILEEPMDQPLTQEERIVELEKQNEFLTDCLLEMSMKVYE